MRFENNLLEVTEQQYGTTFSRIYNLTEPTPIHEYRTLLRCCLQHRQSSATVLSILSPARRAMSSTRYSAVVHFLSPDQSSGNRSQTNCETTPGTVGSGNHWKHCFSASTSVVSALRSVLVHDNALYKSTIWFSIAAPWVWNSLPQELWNCETLDT